MSHMLRLVLVVFRAFSKPTGSSMQHGCDMSREEHLSRLGHKKRNFGDPHHKNRNFRDPHHSRTQSTNLYLCIDSRLEAPMSDSFINQTSRVAIAGRVAEHHRPWNELTLRGDYHPPFGKIEARAEATKWLCLV
jgi:hypothetical protein